MHPVLLIDEILRLIFDYCWTAQHPRRTLSVLACCCRAWKDPALDRLWASMNSLEPLVTLVSTQDESSGYVSQNVLVYAARIRGIKQQARLRAPATLNVSILPRLESVTLSFDGCMGSQTWVVSPALKNVEIYVGFTHAAQATLRSDAAAVYLQSVRPQAPDLRLLQVRGRMTDALNSAVISFTQLHHLTMQGGCYLSCETFAAIATFPDLRSLRIQATHIDANDFEAALSEGLSCFPALEELIIRTHGPLLTSVIARIPVGKLTKLHVDMEKCLLGPSHMKPIFELLADKCYDSLCELAIEDNTDLDDLDASLPARGALRWYNLTLLAPLQRMKSLRSFSLCEPDLHDSELAHLAKWWPALVHLNLGTLDHDVPVPEWKVRLSPAAYIVVAESFPNLETLTLPALPPGAQEREVPTSLQCGQTLKSLETLRSLVIGVVPNAETHAAAVVDALLAMFPALTTLDCPNAEVTDCFDAVHRARP